MKQLISIALSLACVNYPFLNARADGNAIVVSQSANEWARPNYMDVLSPSVRARLEQDLKGIVRLAVLRDPNPSYEALKQGDASFDTAAGGLLSAMKVGLGGFKEAVECAPSNYSGPQVSIEKRKDDFGEEVDMKVIRLRKEDLSIDGSLTKTPAELVAQIVRATHTALLNYSFGDPKNDQQKIAYELYRELPVAMQSVKETHGGTFPLMDTPEGKAAVARVEALKAQLTPANLGAFNNARIEDIR